MTIHKTLFGLSQICSRRSGEKKIPAWICLSPLPFSFVVLSLIHELHRWWWKYLLSVTVERNWEFVRFIILYWETPKLYSESYTTDRKFSNFFGTTVRTTDFFAYQGSINDVGESHQRNAQGMGEGSECYMLLACISSRSSNNSLCCITLQNLWVQLMISNLYPKWMFPVAYGTSSKRLLSKRKARCRLVAGF